MWKTFSSFIKSFLWPKKCINCGRLGSYLCQDCLSLIEVTSYRYCPFCASENITYLGTTCPLHSKTKQLDGLYAAAPFKNKIVQETIRLCKYSPAKELSFSLSFLIISHFKLLNKHSLSFSGFVLCPVPLHDKKLRQRGFNLTEEVARHLSGYLGLPVKNLLLKKKNTLPQTKFNKKQRAENVSGAFAANPMLQDSIAGKKILLVDDVFTTGATLEECAKVLKQNNAREVWGVVAARSRPISELSNPVRVAA